MIFLQHNAISACGTEWYELVPSEVTAGQGADGADDRRTIAQNENIRFGRTGGRWADDFGTKRKPCATGVSAGRTSAGRFLKSRLSSGRTKRTHPLGVSVVRPDRISWMGRLELGRDPTRAEPLEPQIRVPPPPFGPGREYEAVRITQITNQGSAAGPCHRSPARRHRG